MTAQKGIKLSSAQPEYTEVTPEEVAAEVSCRSINSLIYWENAIEALKIARKTMLKRNYNKALYIICSKRRSVTGIRYMPMCKSPYIDKDQGDYCPGCGQKMYWDREEKDVKE